MAASSIKAGEAWWEITARDKATAVVNQIADRLKSIGKGATVVGAAMTGVGAAVLGPLLAAAKGFSDYADGLNDTRIQTGLSVETLSQLSYVAQQQGTSLDGLKKGLVGMAKFTTQVASGGKGAVKVLDALGISSADFMAMSPEQRFRTLADQISKIQDPSLRAGVAMKVFGKAANDLMPTLALGSAGIAAMQKRAEALGLTVSQADADKLGSFGDDLSAVGEQVKMAWWQAGAALIETFGPFVPVIQSAMAALIDFVKTNRPLVSVVLLGAAALMSFGIAATTAGAIVWAAGAAIGGAATIMSTAWGVALGIKTAVIAVNTLLAATLWAESGATTACAASTGLMSIAWGVASAIKTAVVALATLLTTTLFAEGIAATASAAATWVLNVAMGGLAGVLAIVDALLAALLSPLGLVVLAFVAIAAVVTAAVVAFVQLTDAGQQMVASLSAAFGELLAVTGQVFGGIWDALMAGEWGLAASIGFAAVSLAWAVMVAGMSDAWYGFVGFIGSALLSGLQFVDGAIRAVLGGLIDAYNWAAEQMGWATVGSIAEGSQALASWQADLDKWVGDKSKARWGDVKKQRDDITKLTDEAATKRKAREDSLKVNIPDIPALDQPDLSKLAGGGKGGKGDGGGVLGTFNAAVAGMLGSSIPDHLGKIAENTEATNEKLDELIDKADEGGLAWE